jgi:hypothetical protein
LTSLKIYRNRAPHRKEDGVGILQFSIAHFQSGREPSIDDSALSGLLQEFASSRNLGTPDGIKREEAGTRKIIRGDFIREDQVVAVWYVTDGWNVALVTYVSHEVHDPSLATELRDGDSIAASVEF